MPLEINIARRHNVVDNLFRNAIFRRASVKNFSRSLALVLGGVMATPISSPAREPTASAFMKHITALHRINLHYGLNEVSFFGPGFASLGSATAQCRISCPVPGAILKYDDGGPLAFDTYVPFVWDASGGGGKIPYIIELSYKNAYSHGSFEFPGTDHWSRTEAAKTIDFYNAKFDSIPVTLIFIADLNYSNDSPGGYKTGAKLSILEFAQLRIKNHIIAKFKPILSYTVTKYNDSDIALKDEFGLVQENN